MKHKEILSTVAETAVVYAGKLLLHTYLNNRGVSNGSPSVDNPAFEEFIEKYPIRALAATVVVAPAIEEVLFRELPARVPGRTLGWGARMLSLGIFAMAHNISYEEGRGFKGLYLEDNNPVIHFITGAHLDSLRQRRGLGHSILSHGLNNLFEEIRARI